jgi:hypothetical protein
LSGMLYITLLENFGKNIGFFHQGDWG